MVLHHKTSSKENGFNSTLLGWQFSTKTTEDTHQIVCASEIYIAIA